MKSIIHPNTILSSLQDSLISLDNLRSQTKQTQLSWSCWCWNGHVSVSGGCAFVCVCVSGR